MSSPTGLTRLLGNQTMVMKKQPGGILNPSFTPYLFCEGKELVEWDRQRWKGWRELERRKRRENERGRESEREREKEKEREIDRRTDRQTENG